MVEAVPFPEVNMSLVPGASGARYDLPVFTDGKECISCFQMDEEEIAEVVRTGRIWLRVFSGRTQPPVAVDVFRPFED